MADLFRFPFQEDSGSSFADTSGNSLALTPNGITPSENTTTGPGGEYPNAITFNGIDEWFDLPQQTIVGEKTFMWWGLGKKDDVYSVVLGETAIARRVGYRNNNAQLSYVPASGQVYDPAHGVDVQNVWHHVLIRVDVAGVAQTFINGQLIAEEGSGLLSDMVISRIGRDSASNYHEGGIVGLAVANHRYSDVEVAAEYAKGIDSTVALQFYSPGIEGRYHAEPGDTFAIPLEIGYAPGTPSLELQVEDLSGGVVHAWSSLAVTAGTAETSVGPRDAWLGSTPALDRKRYVLKIRETSAPTTVVSQHVGVGRGICDGLSQSNGVGVYTQAQAVVTTGEGDARFFNSTFSVGGEWQVVDEVSNGPINPSVSNQYSVWPLVANLFLEQEPDVPVFFIPVGFGGASIISDWVDGASVMSSAVNTLAASKVNNCTLFMWQGEAHTPEATPVDEQLTASEYVTEVLRAYTTLTAGLTGAPKLYVTQLQPLDDVQSSDYNQTYLNAIRDGQRLLWNQPNVFQGPVFADVLVADLTDEVHLKSATEQQLAADRIYRALTNDDLFAIQSVNPVQGLQTVSITFTKTLQVGTLDASAWSVDATAQTVAVQSAVSDGTTVTLSLDAPLIGSQNIDVGLMQGYSGRGAVVPLDGNGDPPAAEVVVATVVSTTADETAIAFTQNPTIAANFAQAEANAVTLAALAEQVAALALGLGAESQSPLNEDFGIAFTRDASSRSDGTLEAPLPIKIGTSNLPAVNLLTRKVYDRIRVDSLGDATVYPEGELTATASGPTYTEQGPGAAIQLAGTPTAGSKYRIDQPVVMRNGDPDVLSVFVHCVARVDP